MDDYSRYLLVCERFNHKPTTDELTKLLEELPRKPDEILADNGNRFKLGWKRWCKNSGIEPLLAHTYYPQNKGKVERTIGNVAEEFVDLLRKFPEWLTSIWRYGKRYDEHRFRRGINTQPANLYPSV